MAPENYIYKKEVDKSFLKEGFSIPVANQVYFQKSVDQFLKRGQRKSIKILLDGDIYNAKLVNQSFDENKYPAHKDILQIRYTPKGDLSKRLKQIFFQSHDYIDTERSKLQKISKRYIKIPPELKEYGALYTTDDPDTLLLECITESDNEFAKSNFSNMNEEEFEFENNYKTLDTSAKIESKLQLTKIRKLDKAIGENLKIFYDFRCQICGRNVSVKYGTNIVEAHHIEPFVTSLNNNAENIMILCPNHHRIIHKTNPTFNRETLLFKYENGWYEKLKLNAHLQNQFQHILFQNL